MPSEDTQFKQGQSGNPGGRPKGTVSVTRLIHEELAKGDESTARLLVRAMIRQAKKGNVAAFKELIERTDGRTVQGHELTGADGGAIDFTIRMVTNDDSDTAAD